MRLRSHHAGVLAVAALAAALSACSTSGSGPSASLAAAPGADAAASYAATGAGATGALRVVQELPAPANTNGGSDQLISPNDTLDVDFFQVEELDRTVQVDAGGQISLPLVGTVPAAGKSVRTLEAEIEGLYGARYLQNPEIVVFMKESAGQRVTVDGEVAKAGIYPVTAGSSLQQVLAQAGGFRPIGDPSKVFVFRDIGAERLVANYNVSDIRAGRRADPPIYGGDTIVVFSSAGKVALQNLKEALGVARGAAFVVP